MSDNREPENNGNPWIKSLLVWGGIFLALLLVVSMFGGPRDAAGSQLGYSDFRQKVAQGTVDEVQISPEAITGKLKNGQTFSTVPVANDTGLTKLLDDNGVRYSGAEKQEMSVLAYILIQSLPFLLILGVAFFAFLSFVPLLGAVVMTYGLVADPATVAGHMQTIINLVPTDAAKLIQDQLTNVATTAATKAGLGLLIALAFSIYGAMRASGAIIQALGVIYEEEDSRSILHFYSLSARITLVAIGAGVVGLFAAGLLGYLGNAVSILGETGVIVMGYRPASTPFSYLDTQLRPTGYTVELCERIVAAVRTRLQLPDLEVRRVEVASATRMPLVINGTLDLECGITTHNAERARNQAFSLTIFVAETRLMTRASERVQSLADLRGQPVASTIGTTSIQHLAKVNEQQGLGIRILGGLDDPEGLQLVRSGRASAFLMDDVILRAVLAQQGPGADDYRISDTALTLEPYAIGLNREDPAFKAKVDAVLRNLYRSGEIREIYREWFESPIPLRGINLKMPMSPAFRRIIDQPTDAADPALYR